MQQVQVTLVLYIPRKIPRRELVSQVSYCCLSAALLLIHAEEQQRDFLQTFPGKQQIEVGRG